MAGSFGVSRTAVREALRALEADGVVTIRVGARGGAFVTAPTSVHAGKAIDDLIMLSGLTAAQVAEAWRVLEIGFVPLVCARASDEDVADLWEICDRTDAALAAGHYDVSLSAEFHLRVAKATQNAAIDMLAQSFHGPAVMSLQTAQDEDTQFGVAGAGERRQFVIAVSEGDTAAAEAVLTEYLTGTVHRLRPRSTPRDFGPQGAGISGHKRASPQRVVKRSDRDGG